MLRSDGGPRQAFEFIVDRSLLLLAGSTVALIWANLGFASYERLVHAVHFAVNDVGMVFFFGLAAKEVIEATAPGGVLHSPRRAALPLAAAVGGMVCPAAIYVALAIAADARDLIRGWAIPCATDIAFSSLVVRFIFGAHHPAVPFLLFLAIADDALGLVILAAFYPTGDVRPVEFGSIVLAAMGVAWWLRRRRTLSFWPYVLGAGAVSWLAFYRGGLHPALALVPILPFLPHARRDPGFFEGRATLDDPLSAFEHWWKAPVQLILFCFGLVNAGVPFSNVGAGTWIVLAAILIGKPVGIVLSTGLGVAAGLHRPADLTWREQIVIGISAAIGFTVALFFATAAFADGAILDETKMGALFSFSAAGLACAAAWMLGVGRASDPTTPAPR